MIFFLLPLIAGSLIALAFGARILYNNKVAESFGLGIDFGKAIASMTAEQIERINAENFPVGIPHPRTNTDH